MKNLLSPLVGLALACPNSFGQIWINEVSYAMTGTDSDDFIEIVGPVGTDLSDYGVMLVNGSTSSNYDYKQLSGTISSVNSNSGLGFFVVLSNQSSSVTIPTGIDSMYGDFTSIQNGPDGVLLINHSTQETIHGVWYKNDGNPPTSIVRSGSGNPPGDGPYSMNNVDLTIAEDVSNSAAGFGIGMDGGGFSRNWVFQESTPGQVNTSQSSLPIKLISFSHEIREGEVELKWETSFERDVDYFLVSKHDRNGDEKGYWEIPANAGSSENQIYSLIDHSVFSQVHYYNLFEVHVDGGKSLLKTIAVKPNYSKGHVFWNGEGVEIKLPHLVSGVVEIKVFDLNGQIKLNQTQTVNNEDNLILPFERNYLKGLFIVSILNKQSGFTENFVVEL